MSDQRLAKDAAGKAAANLIKDGMLVGLGTGSTAACFIEHLVNRCKQGLRIQVVATSIKSLEMAEFGCIPTIDINTVEVLDVTVDGADEIDPQKRMIKGGGGALLREKIVATMSKEMIVIVDETKLVKKLGAVPLPVEIVPFAYKATISKIERLGYRGELRKNKQNMPYVTDNHNYIFDIRLDPLSINPEQTDHQLHSIPGIVETGLFINIAGRVIVGYEDGRTDIRS
jgi:ribose 5-phosphate isomerase A